jgi:hypothetical protein
MKPAQANPNLARERRTPIQPVIAPESVHDQATKKQKIASTKSAAPSAGPAVERGRAKCGNKKKMIATTNKTRDAMDHRERDGAEEFWSAAGVSISPDGMNCLP